MSINQFLARQAFEPEAITNMSLALEGVCEALGISVRDDAITRLVAEKIIMLAQRGVRDVPTLTERALQEFRREK